MFPPLRKAEGKKEWARETERERTRRQKREQVRMSQTDRKRNRNIENESTSQTYYYPFCAARKATLSALIVQWCWGGPNPLQVHFMTTSILLFVMGRDNVYPHCLALTDAEPLCSLPICSDKIDFAPWFSKLFPHIFPLKQSWSKLWVCRLVWRPVKGRVL